MKSKGFIKTFLEEGKKYCLPLAEYKIEGDWRIEEVLEKADQAASTVEKKYSIVTSLVLETISKFLMPA